MVSKKACVQTWENAELTHSSTFGPFHQLYSSDETLIRLSTRKLLIDHFRDDIVFGVSTILSPGPVELRVNRKYKLLKQTSVGMPGIEGFGDFCSLLGGGWFC
jgi:hypothetical protein